MGLQNQCSLALCDGRDFINVCQYEKKCKRTYLQKLCSFFSYDWNSISGNVNEGWHYLTAENDDELWTGKFIGTTRGSPIKMIFGCSQYKD